MRGQSTFRIVQQILQVILIGRQSLIHLEAMKEQTPFNFLSQILFLAQIISIYLKGKTINSGPFP
jgi:hypothetical protein